MGAGVRGRGGLRGGRRLGGDRAVPWRRTGSGGRPDGRQHVLGAAPETTAAASTTSLVKRPLALELVEGATGDDVKMVQQRLYDIGFDPGGVDGVYGPTTIQAVWAYEKLVLGTPADQVTGQVTPAMWDRMQDPLGVAPLGRTARHARRGVPAPAGAGGLP